mmetsp:Transcript_7059/g.15313  ORF Transcript_7059/g.15313 Transcript_7059/m.15313 type:complete len:322 (-) Transcript_7059:571-1536(-)
MAGITTSVSLLAIAAISSYWSFFFGSALVSTFRLYQKGGEIYNVLHSITHKHTERSNITNRHVNHAPLIMHRMWKNDDIIEKNDHELPANWTKAFLRCNEQYSRWNWTTILWTDDSIAAFIEKHFPTFMPTYNAYPYNIQRVDAARYFILYHYGGVYMDLDVGCKKDKDLGRILDSMEILEKVAVLPLTQPVGVSNDVLFATKESPFFKELMDALPSENKWYGSPYLTVMYSTGPMFVSLQYMKLSRAMQRGVLALSPEMYSGRDTRYFKHLRGSTWHQNDVHAITWMFRNKCVIVVVLFLTAVTLYKVKRIRHKHANKRV